MTSPKIKYYIVILAIFFSWTNFVNADLEITEVMYNSEGSDIDWIEVYNPDSSSVDLTSYKLLISNSTSNHSINKYSGSQTLSKGSYGVIVPTSSISAFISKWDNVANVFTSSFSLPNVTDDSSVSIEVNNGDKSQPIDSFEYSISQGANGNGNSLQKINSDWGESNPTPGKENVSSNEEGNSDSSDDNDDSEETSSDTSNKDDEEVVFKITTKIISPKIVTAGIPFQVSSLTTTNTGKTYEVGRYIWNFGDGESTQLNKSLPFDYEYKYPGEYVLSLSYYDNSISEVADATNRMTIKVIPAEINISSVGNISDPFIELENKSNYEIVLSNWVVTGGRHYFVIPEGTTILAGKKIKLSPKITGFVAEDLNLINITSTSKNVVAVYPVGKVYKSSQKSSAVSTSNKIIPTYSQKDSSTQVINLNDLEADAGSSSFKISNKVYPYIGLAVIVILGLSSFLMIKRKGDGEDYLDKQIRAKDITIVE